MFLHDFQFVLLRVAHHFLYDVLDCLDEVLELHLVGVRLVPHDLYEHQVVVVLG